MRRAVLAVLPLVTMIAWATTVIPMSIERLTARSTHVVRVRALQYESKWNAQHDRIFTYTKFLVLETMKGAAPATITVKQLGGHADGYTMKVSGVRSWRNGEEAILFLQSTSEPATFTVTGLMQGDFRVERQAGQTIVSNGVPDATEIKSDGAFQQYRGATMSLGDLQQRVRKADIR